MAQRYTPRVRSVARRHLLSSAPARVTGPAHPSRLSPPTTPGQRAENVASHTFYRWPSRENCVDAPILGSIAKEARPHNAPQCRYDDKYAAAVGRPHGARSRTTGRSTDTVTRGSQVPRRQLFDGGGCPVENSQKAVGIINGNKVHKTIRLP
ncbi:hypothetical protein BC834DRAFT_166382 [Gloeopeniophorella convolvens]|nr:hypothetical protein BC834DRAFT_166382 [Gloeopeniophorella convolvens]